MAKIYSKNKQYNGISASVNFIDGVGESNLPHLLAWFQENGYTIVEDKREPSIYDSMAYKELTDLAKERGSSALTSVPDQKCIGDFLFNANIPIAIKTVAHINKVT